MQEWTSSLCWDRRGLVEHVGPLLPILTFLFFCRTCLSWIPGKVRVQENVRTAANSLPEFFQTHFDCDQAECLRQAPVPDPVTGRWKRSRSEHAESSSRPAKDSLDGEDHFLQNFKNTSDKCHSHACWDEPESWNPRRIGRATWELSRQRSCTGQLSSEPRCPS